MKNSGFNPIKEIKNINQAIGHYLQEMLELYHRDVPPGINDYCSILKDLFYSFFEFLPGNKSKDNVEIEINEKFFPEVSRCFTGAVFSKKVPPGFQIPMMRIWDRKLKLYGYIDVLPPGTTKKEIGSYCFIDLYKRVFPNLILTNFFEFRYYRRAQKVLTTRLFSVSHLGGISKKMQVKSTRIFLKILQHFYGYNEKKSKDSSFIHLQQQLALKTFYLREYVLTPLMNHLICKGIKSELFRLYRAYCYFFNRELSVKEFSAFLSHVIIDGFLRACIFYLTTNSNPDKPFSRHLVLKYAKFTGMPERRLAVFKYLSPGPGDEQIPGAFQWILDEICVFLENFDFKQMGFSSKNHLVMDGESLQWEGYFFRPYYDNEEYKVVLELLQKAGIFSHEVKGKI